MDQTKGTQIIVNGGKAFHDRLTPTYGQLILRLDDESYLASSENLRLSRLQSDDVARYDINSGDIGAILKSRSDINAIAIIVTEYAVKYSSEDKVIKPSLDDFAQIIGPDAPIIDNVTSRLVLNAVQNRGGCLVRGVCIIGVGRNMPEAVAAAQIIEKACEAEQLASKIGGVKYLDTEVASALHEDYLKSYSIANTEEFVNYIGHNEDEFNKRNLLIECGKQMCKDDLVHGCWGNISIKLNDNEMLITPSGMDYFDIKIEDIVKVNLDTLEYGDQRKPSTESRLHANMYKSLPGCNAILHAHSNACSVFASANAGFIMEDPTLKSLIGDLLVAEYAPSGSDELAANVVETMKKTHAAVLPNHGTIFYGPDLDVVRAIANAVEAKATNLLGYNKVEEKNDEEA